MAFFDKDQLDWTTTQPALHDFYKTLSAFRISHSAIITGDTFNLPTDANGVMAYIRHDAAATVLVVLNLSPDHHKVSFSHEKLAGSFQNLFSGFNYSFQNEASFELLPGDFFVYVKG